MSKKILIGIGNPIIDISNTTNDEILEKYKIPKNLTTFANENNIGFFNELENQPNCSYLAGGSVTNTIRVANWMLNNSEGFGCKMIGCVGKDTYGDKIISELKKVNVELLFEICEKESTSRCACGITGKARTLVPDIKASNKLTLSFVESKINDILSSEILLIEGYFLIECWDIVKYLYEEFKKAGKKIAFTLSAVFMIEVFFERVKLVADCADFIFANEDEIRAFVKMFGYDPLIENKKNAEIIFKNLKINENRILILTHGAEPTTLCTWDYTNQNFNLLIEEEIYHINNDEIVDTNGCGDALVGGFFSEYLKGSELYTCIKAGQYAASVIIKNIGCNYPNKPNFKLK